MTKPHASERMAFPDEANGGTPRFVGEIQMFDPARNFGKINHVLPDGNVVRVFFHVDEFKRMLIDKNRFYFGQKVEYSVRAKKPPSNDSTTKQHVARSALETLKAVDCVIYIDEPKLSNVEIADLLATSETDQPDNG